MTEHFDVVIVGAGISGICAGYYLQQRCPDRSYVILEGREAMGGTWDLFRYPGIRSDSDMYTLGFSFRPWLGDKAIAEGEDILSYLKDTAREYGIDQKIRYNHWVERASWSSAEGRWELHAQAKGEATTITGQFLYMCSGYYDYEQGYTPEFKGQDRFQGEIVHPQKWSEEIDYTDKRVVVIGSGATAVTLVPSMAEKASHVTMLQRSPTYVISRPARDKIARWLIKRLPKSAAYRMTRWKNILLSMYFFNISKRRPERVKAYILDLIRKDLGPDYDVDTHFTPRYNPWDQRLCLVPDNDLFEAIKAGKVSVVTEHIESFTEEGIALASGDTLPADMIVTATGLNLVFMGKVKADIDGEALVPGEHLSYRGVMLQDVPNLALSTGYTNASWTLKCELTCRFVCRLLNWMKDHGHHCATPRLRDDSVEKVPFMALSAGYIKRGEKHFPRQGSKTPWRLHQNYVLDTVDLKLRKIDDGSLEFG